MRALKMPISGKRWPWSRRSADAAAPEPTARADDEPAAGVEGAGPTAPARLAPPIAAAAPDQHAGDDTTKATAAPRPQESGASHLGPSLLDYRRASRPLRDPGPPAVPETPGAPATAGTDPPSPTTSSSPTDPPPASSGAETGQRPPLAPSADGWRRRAEGLDITEPISQERWARLLSRELADPTPNAALGLVRWVLALSVGVTLVLGAITYVVVSQATATRDELTQRLLMQQMTFDEFRARSETATSALQARLDAAWAAIEQARDRPPTTASVEPEEPGANGEVVRHPAAASPMTHPAAPPIDRLILDARGTWRQRPATPVRAEGQPPVGDPDIDAAYQNLGIVHDFFVTVFGRDSYDDRGARLVATVHYGERFDDSFWNGSEFVFGGGDGRLFERLVVLDVVAKQFGDAVVQSSADLRAQGEAGALATHLADVFSVLTVQWHRGERAEEATWTLGRDMFPVDAAIDGLRTFGPGKAFANHPTLGTDPQAKHIRDQSRGGPGNGDRLIDSGIPNHAFYVAARQIGGFAWETAGRIWYQSLLRLAPDTTFAAFARTTFTVAGDLFGVGSPEQRAVAEGWAAVGIGVRGRRPPRILRGYDEQAHSANRPALAHAGDAPATPTRPPDRQGAAAR